MDWAEELKMSIRKTTARRGRRSKSRDELKELDTDRTTQSSGTNPSTLSSTPLKETIDITLDLQQNTTTTVSSGNATPMTSYGGSNIDSDSRRPPLRRISGGWADAGSLKSSKSKKGSFDDDRFQLGSQRSTNSPLQDDIPVIPDLDDIKEDILLNEIVEPPSVNVNRVVTLKELNSDLLSQNAFSAIEDVDLSILTSCLHAQETLDEADEIWDWEKLFTDVTAEIHSDKSTNAIRDGIGLQKLEIGPDEIPPPLQV